MKTITKLITAFAVLAVMTGCQKSPLESSVDSNESELTMCADIGDVTIPTKALSSGDESAISRLDLLVFTSNGSSDTFAYAVEVRNPVVTGGSLNYTVRLKHSTTTEKYKLVLLANLASTPVIAVGTERETALAALTFTPATNWTTGAIIPMWAGYPTAVTINASTTPANFGSAALIRSLARVNVVNAATSTFTLNKVHVYNTANKASVAPVYTNYDAAVKKVTAPTLPSGVGITATYTKTAVAEAVTSEIYIGESNKQVAGNASAVCLVLEGTYAGATHFYRVDMVSSSDNTTILPILRNHTYTVKVSKMKINGYSTAAEAFASLPVNGSAEVIVSDDMSDATTDGKYFLAVDKSSFDIPKSTFSGSVVYKTDYPSTLQVATTDPWITISSGIASPINFTCAANTANIARQGAITITAGQMVKKIIINQESATPGPIIVWNGSPYNQTGDVSYGYSSVSYNGFYGENTSNPGTNGGCYNTPQDAYMNERPYQAFEVAKSDAYDGASNLKSWKTLQGNAANRGDNICVQTYGKNWRLPRFSELRLIYENGYKLNKSGNGYVGLVSAKYMSATEGATSLVYCMLGNGTAATYDKIITDAYVRCIKEVPPLPAPILEFGVLPYNETGAITTSTKTSYNEKYGAVPSNGDYQTSYANAYINEPPFYRFEIARTDSHNGVDSWVLTQGTFPGRGDNRCVLVHGAGWRIPRLSELRLMFENRVKLNAVLGFAPLDSELFHWSATECNASEVWCLAIDDYAEWVLRKKTVSLALRCIREIP